MASVTQNIWGSPSRVNFEKSVASAKKAGAYPQHRKNLDAIHTPVKREERDAIKARIAAHKAVHQLYI